MEVEEELEVIPVQLLSYDQEDIYNMDETALFWKLPSVLHWLRNSSQAARWKKRELLQISVAMLLELKSFSYDSLGRPKIRVLLVHRMFTLVTCIWYDAVTAELGCRTIYFGSIYAGLMAT